MDTSRIKTFAAESRKILKEGVMQRIKALGFDEQGRTPDEPQKIQGGTLYLGRMIENERFYDSWIALNDHIQKLGKNGVRQVYEEAAYTWFNRLIAIRIMQKNNFIEPVLSYDDPDIRVPHIVSEARRGHFMTSLTDDEQSRLRNLLMDDTKTQEQFAILIIAYCRENKVISKCFGGIAQYLELLLPDDILSQNRFIDLLNNTNDYITDEQFQSAELIGWLYQFYISEKKDEVFASFKSGKKAEAEDIPAATQIFTPNWIVKYMVQNTVGRIYLDNNPYCPLKKDWKYLVEPSEQREQSQVHLDSAESRERKAEGQPAEKTPKEAILNIDNLEDLTLADLACGSGHILVEGFDILYSLYIDEGYSRYDAIKNIFTKNLTGIDLDTRAKQLATFALLLKAAQIDPTFLDGEVMPRVYDMPNVNLYTWRDLGGHMITALNIVMSDKSINEELEECFTLMEQAQNLGSIMKFNISDATREFIKKCVEEQNRQHKFEKQLADLFHGFNIILALTEKYAALAMNPPYMGSGNMNANLSDYVKKKYEKGKGDLCTVFMLMQAQKNKENGLYANIIPPSWMFLSTFEELRKIIIKSNSINTIVQLSNGVFGGDFGSTVSVIANHTSNGKKAVFFRIVEKTFQLIDQDDLRQILSKTLIDPSFKFDFKNYKRGIIAHSDKGNRIVYTRNQNDFERIPGCTIGYWISNNLLELFASSKLGTLCETRLGMATANNDLFLRYFWELSFTKIMFNCDSTKTSEKLSYKWYPYAKGGPFRKWYGNLDYCVNWLNNGYDIRNYADEKGRIRSHNYNLDYIFRKGITWNTLSSNDTSFRVMNHSLFDDKGSSLFVNNSEDSKYEYILGFLNSKLVKVFVPFINPTISYQPGTISSFPFVFKESDLINNEVQQSVAISKQDWDVHETSWDFEVNELVSYVNESREQGLECTFTDKAGNFGSYSSDAKPSFELKDLYQEYITKWTEKFAELHSNEEELNRLFIEIYGLQDELTPDVPLDEITILQQGEISIEDNQIKWHADVVMKQLISYAIGCMMGRYRLDKPGLCIAHPNPSESEYAPYQYHGETFEIDEDGIIPLMPKDSRFDDNAVNRFTDFIKIVFGEETLTDNMNFLEEKLGKSVEQYLIKDFWKDHKKMYQNRPIYWLFSSKKGAFQVIAYMHRMNKYTAENIRNKYLLPHMDYLRKEIADLDSRITALTPQERKQYQKLQKDLEECMEYHDRLHMVADQQIAFDLDDGVVVNYAKFGDVLAKLK